MEDCIFCKIVAGDIPAEKVYESEDALAFFSIGPVNPGHTLVIPKAHSRSALTMEGDDFVSLMKYVHMIADAVKNAAKADGVNISFNCEAAAGQEVFHTHVHIIPRYDEDGHVHWPASSYDETRSREIATAMRAQLE